MPMLSNPEKQNILLVEDDWDDVVFIRNLLTEVRYPIEVVKDGEAALEYLMNLDGKPAPCLVLLDLRLPKLHGLEVLQALRQHERTNSIPVVILTSSAEEEEMLSSYREGANSFLRKPPKREELMNIVRLMGIFSEENNPVR